MNRHFNTRAGLLLAAVLLAGAAGGLGAQEPERILVPRKPFIALSGDLSARNLLLMGSLLQANLQMKTETEPVTFSVLEAALPREALVERAKAVGADCVVSVSAASQEDRVLLRESFLELDRAEPLWEGTASTGLAPKELEESAWSGLIEAARIHLIPAPQKIIVKEVLVEKGVVKEIEKRIGLALTLKGLPGTVVYGIDREIAKYNVGSPNGPMYQNIEVTVPTEIPEGGSVVREVAPFSSYLLRVEKLGYMPMDYAVGIGLKPKEVTLVLREPTRLEVEAFSNFFQDSGMGLLYHFIPGSLFLGGGFSQSFARFSNPVMFRPGELDWWRRNLQVYFEMGWKFMPADSPFRLSLGSMFNLNFIAPVDKGLRIHPLYPLFFSPTLKLEFSPVENFTVFLRWSPRFIAGWSEDPTLYSAPGSPFYGLNDSPYGNGTSFMKLLRAPYSNYAIDINPIPLAGFRIGLPN